MKIDLSTIDRESFSVTPHELFGETVYLVNPQHIGVKWTKDNLIFRSSVWDSSGELISAGFKKFFNWGEQPDLVPHPTDLKHVSLPEKLDGSLMIVSIWKGNLIIRTRGTVNARLQKNGDEIDYLIDKYPKAFQFNEETSGYSRLFEWTTPTNRIVLDYGSTPDMVYIGKVSHIDYRYERQDVLNAEAVQMGVKRPVMYNFNTIDNMIESIKMLVNKEGVVAYSGKNEQILIKIKSLDYLAKHAFRSNASFENVLELFLQNKCPSYAEFQAKIVETFDYEIFMFVQGYVSQVCDSYKEAVKILEHMKKFVNGIRGMPSRKLQAQAIIGAYGNCSRSGFVFSLLDNKPVTNEMIKKLIFQIAGK